MSQSWTRTMLEDAKGDLWGKDVNWIHSSSTARHIRTKVFWHPVLPSLAVNARYPTEIAGVSRAKPIQFSGSPVRRGAVVHCRGHGCRRWFLSRVDVQPALGAQDGERELHFISPECVHRLEGHKGICASSAILCWTFHHAQSLPPHAAAAVSARVSEPRRCRRPIESRMAR